MARRRYRRSYRRRTGKWAPNIQEIIESVNIPTPGPVQWFQSVTLMSNPTQSPTFVSQVFTVKNIEITFNIDAKNYGAVNDNEGITCYIMYVPQGMTITADYNINHPEYIMAYKYIGSPTSEANQSSNSYSQNYQPIRVKTRLARKLQTGDGVILFVKGTNTSAATQSPQPVIEINGLVRWWTKAN